MAVSARNKSRVFVIGSNLFCTFGLGHSTPIRKLTEIKDIDRICNIYSSYSYTIYSDDDYKNIWSVGRNTHGQCGRKGNSELFEKITFFEENQINIKKICVSSVGCSTFFITKDNKVYCCGSNKHHKLGLQQEDIPQIIKNQNQSDSKEWKGENQFEPILISQLTDVIDVKPTWSFSIALCKSDDYRIVIIIDNWCRLFMVPDDIKSLLIMLTKFSKVYSTIFSAHGHGDKYEKKKYFGWKEIDSLSDKNIIKINVGDTHSNYLGADGVVYACGDNSNGQCGLGCHIKKLNVPTEIGYFREHGIKIVDIVSTFFHSLALDTNGKVYSWGSNNYGQCGVGRSNYIRAPVLVEDLKEYKVDLIRCALHNSYCRTVCGKHFLWGINRRNECLTFDGEYNKDLLKPVYDDQLRPHRIDLIVKEKCCTQKIIDVYPSNSGLSIMVE